MENLSLFDMTESGQQQINIQPSASLDVVKMIFDGAESCTWQELFSGFDTLHAITYSSGIDFVYQLIDLFEQAEILFGCDEVISHSLQEVMAYQCKMVERMRDTASKMKLDLVSRIGNGSLRFFVARSVLSHEKLYLLSSQDGRKRVIMGSANLSRSAFGGYQRENICYVDGDAAYDWYWDCYCQLREDCTDQIAKETLLFADDGTNLEELPIARTVKVKKALVLQPAEEAKEEVRFVLDVKNLAGKFASSVPKPDKKGKLILSPDKIKSIRRQVVAAQTQEKELQSEYPQLEVFPDEMMVRLNGVNLDLHPSAAEIQKDVSLFLKYMDGYEKFHGNVTGMQRRYFEFANWFFCSPFMACMRDMAVCYNQNLLPYPVFGLVYGQSKAGKTSFLETLLKMMIGQKTKISAPEFTRSSIEGLKRTVKGAPIIVDDLTNTRFNQHAIETIKNDDFGVADKLLHYPAVVISANEDVKAVAPEVIRRTVICRVQAGLTNTEVMRSSVVRTVQKEVGTALYREYLRRMLGIVSELLEEMKSDESESAPDILAESSRVLEEIFREYAEAPWPNYIRQLTLEDYFSEKVTGSYAIKTIRNAWNTSRSSFELSERNNEIRYNAGAPWEADRILKELPETLEPHKSREWVVMNLDEARSFFDIPFKKSWLDRLQKR
ncbi:phospholipase D family protein [Intestinimonas sp. MSJ-38]|uniref:phospholipase D family protein n=1 Tax=Intestinimonas sp. MSJ-38 TaxID=2841532 RepID=UPI001C1120E4|nr:phospholipase D family protein [Intestinimonas sp. MSJ-38]MBU5432318.1 phospholipase D family protein [Intestinimonas sp. MSJ-38]